MAKHIITTLLALLFIAATAFAQPIKFQGNLLKNVSIKVKNNTDQTQQACFVSNNALNCAIVNAGETKPIIIRFLVLQDGMMRFNQTPIEGDDLKHVATGQLVKQNSKTRLINCAYPLQASTGYDPKYQIIINPNEVKCEHIGQTRPAT